MGKRTKFFLGYEENNKLVSLSILDNNNKLVDDTLTGVINYTSSFNNEKELRESLKNSSMHIEIPEGAKLCYLAETGYQKYPYKKVLGLNTICYSTSKSLMDPATQERYIEENKYDLSFLQNLYLVVLHSMISIVALKECYQESDYDKGNTAETMIGVYRTNKELLTNNYVKHVINMMDLIYSEACYANSIGLDNYEYEIDKQDLDYLIKRFYQDYTIKKDSKYNFKYDPNNGKYLRKSRIMGYLTILITKDIEEKYEKYLKELEEENKDIYRLMSLEEPIENESTESEDLYCYRDDSSPEEYLTIEDFELSNQDYETNGFKRRGAK